MPVASQNETYHPHVRQLSTWRWIFAPVCWLTGHTWGWISPVVPNPYALTSWVYGCGRCSKTFTDRRRAS